MNNNLVGNTGDALTVVIVSNTAKHCGGASKVAIDSAIGLKRHGIHVIFFSGMGPISDELVSAGIEVVCLNRKPYLESGGIRGIVHGLWDRQAAKAFQQVLSNLNPEQTVVHFHSWQHALSSSPISVAARMGFHVVITAHEYSLVCPNMALFDYKKNSLCQLKPMSVQCLKRNCDKRSYIHKIYRFMRECLLKKSLKKAHLNIIYISKRSQEIIESKISGKIATCKSFYLPDPVNVSKQKSLEFDDRDDYVVFVGRLSPEKDPETFCRAVSKNGIHGIVVGSGELQKELEAKYSQIEFVGWKSHEEVLSYIAKSKGLVFSSVCYETAGLSVLEANMSSATPCVISDVSVTSEYAKENCGLLFKAGDYSNLAYNLEQLLKKETFQEMQSAILEKDFSVFEEKTHVIALISIYKSIIANTGSCV